MRNSNLYCCWCAVAALVVLLPACNSQTVERTAPDTPLAPETPLTIEDQAEATPTVDKRVLQAFGPAKSPDERYESALSDASIVRQHVLLLFAPAESPDAAAFIIARSEDRKLRGALEPYQVVVINTSDEKFDEALPVIEKLGLEIDPGADAMLVFADAQGEVLHQEMLGRLVRETELDTVGTTSLLVEHAPEPLDANELLASALADAVAHDKRVIVQETATWCGPCWRLSRYFHANEEKLEEEYILVKMDHRWIDAEQIMEGIRDGASGGIPWWAILDSDGEVLITSNNEDGRNIGFPGSDAGKAHYRTMLETTAQRLDEEQIDALVDAVN